MSTTPQASPHSDSHRPAAMATGEAADWLHKPWSCPEQEEGVRSRWGWRVAWEGERKGRGRCLWEGGGELARQDPGGPLVKTGQRRVRTEMGSLVKMRRAAQSRFP